MLHKCEDTFFVSAGLWQFTPYLHLLSQEALIALDIRIPLLVKLKLIMQPRVTELWPHLFYGAVGERMCGHVKKQEILLLCSQNTFLHQVFRQTFSHISQLVVQLQGIPGLSWETR